MNILLINHYAGSPEMGMEFRPYYLAKEWTKMGHKVDIIAASYSHLRRINPEIRKNFELAKIDGITYYWIKTNKYTGNGTKRAMTMARFVSALWLKSKWIADTLAPDVVICSSTYPLDTYVGQKIRKISRKNVKVIHEVHDMWPISPIEIGGMSPAHPFIRIMQKAENSFCKNADLIVSLLPATKNYFMEHGMKANKFCHVPNGVVLKDWENYQQIPEELSKHFNKSHEEGKFNLCFFGSIHKVYNLDILIEAAKVLKDENIMFTLIGQGVDKDELIRLAKGFEGNIKFFNPIPKASIPDLFNYIDASFVSLKNPQISRFGISMNKLFDSMMGGKPILYMIEAPNNYIKDYQCGISVDEHNIRGLGEAILRLIQSTPDELHIMGENGREAAINRFNYTKLAEKFIEAIENI